jgi:hypothetical protein
MVSSFFSLLRAFVEHALGLAGQGARDGVELHHIDRVEMPMMVLMWCCSSLLMAWISRLSLPDSSRCTSQRTSTLSRWPSRRQHDLVIARQALVAQDLLFDLGREHVDAAHDQHVVGAPGDLAMRRKAREVGGSRRVRSRVR